MSDIPAMIAAFACLAIGAAALRLRPVQTHLVLASVLVGFFAFTIRDFAVAAPASVVVAALCLEPRRRYWLIAIALGLACAGVYVWRATLPGQFGDLPFYANGVARIIEAIFSASLVLSPAAILAAARWRHHWRRFDLIVGVELGLVLVGLRVIQWVSTGEMPVILLDNLARRSGARPARTSCPAAGRPSSRIPSGALSMSWPWLPSLSLSQSKAASPESTSGATGWRFVDRSLGSDHPPACYSFSC